MASDGFVSHSIKDKAIAEAIVARLETDSVTCWIAPRAGPDVPGRPESRSIATPPVAPSGRQPVPGGVIIAVGVLGGSAGWYLGEHKKGPLAGPAVTAIETSTPVPITGAAVTPRRAP